MSLNERRWVIEFRIFRVVILIGIVITFLLFRWCPRDFLTKRCNETFFKLFHLFLICDKFSFYTWLNVTRWTTSVWPHILLLLTAPSWVITRLVIWVLRCSRNLRTRFQLAWWSSTAFKRRQLSVVLVSTIGWLLLLDNLLLVVSTWLLWHLPMVLCWSEHILSITLQANHRHIHYDSRHIAVTQIMLIMSCAIHNRLAVLYACCLRWF